MYSKKRLLLHHNLQLYIKMEYSQQTIQQVDRAIDKIIGKFPQNDEVVAFTDIHLKVIQDSGEILAYDDDDQEINRCVVDEWIENPEDSFYQDVAALLRQRLKEHSKRIDEMGIAKPFSFVLEDDENEAIAELYLADDETIIIGGDLMDNLDSDLDSFFDELMKE